MDSCRLVGKGDQEEPKRLCGETGSRCGKRQDGKRLFFAVFGRDRRRFHRAANHTDPLANETDLRANENDVWRLPSQRLQDDDANPSAPHDGSLSFHQQTEISNNEYRSWEVEKVDN